MAKPFSRPDVRAPNALRHHRITPGVMKHAEGSVLVEFGDTRVLCSLSVDERVPRFLHGTGKGWLSAEYGMLPRATETRNMRDVKRAGPNGRSIEIGRLIGRALRPALDMKALGERTLWIDCDVLQADGGTRTAAITGSFVALATGLANLQRANKLAKPVLKGSVAAVSVGIYQGVPILDLNYPEDRDADSDVNVVMFGDGRLVEVQGTAEEAPFSFDEFNQMMELARSGIATLNQAQLSAMAPFMDAKIWVDGAKP